MRGFKTIPPPQKYMNLTQIYETYGTGGVVAYSCTLDAGVPTGGFVVAVQAGESPRDIKAYLHQFKNKFPEKAAVCYIRVPIFEKGKPLGIIYDNGTGDKKALPKLEAPAPSQQERLVSMIPDEIIAKMIETAFQRDELG
jgi:hypothetical protein